MKSQEFGQIINLLSNDLNAIEDKTIFFFISLSFPILMIGLVAGLFITFGWKGMFIILTVLAFFPLQLLIGKMNARSIQRVNAFKDKRVKVSTQVIEGIKSLKLYGWEMVFNQII